MIKLHLIVVAAGLGTRLGSSIPKALVEVESGYSLLDLTLDRFSKAFGLLEREYRCERVLITYPEGWLEEFRAVVDRRAPSFPNAQLELCMGGETRQMSVKQALEELRLQGAGPKDLIAIHDAARCLVEPRLIQSVVAAAKNDGAATLGVPVADSLRVVTSPAHIIAQSVPREGLWQIQTPQVFEFQHIFRAHGQLASERHQQSGESPRCLPQVTDDTELVREYSPVKVVQGSQLNFKVTTPDDFALLRLLLSSGNLSL